jgi:hypothetical protein
MISHLLNFTLVLAVVSQIACTAKHHSTVPDDVQQNLQGTWQTQSFLLEGTEVMGTMIAASSLSLEPNGENTGRFQWHFTYPNGTAEAKIGDYKCNGNALILQGLQETAIPCTIHQQAGEITLYGAFDIGTFELELTTSEGYSTLPTF